MQLDFYEPQTWRENGFGAFAPESTEWRGDPDARLAFLKEALRVAKKFRGAMQPKQAAAKYPPVLVVGSKTHDTMRHIRRRPPAEDAAARRRDFEGTPDVGDGGVLFRGMLPPDPIKHPVALSNYRHSFLLNDPKMQDAIARFLFADTP